MGAIIKLKQSIIFRLRNAQCTRLPPSTSSPSTFLLARSCKTAFRSSPSFSLGTVTISAPRISNFLRRETAAPFLQKIRIGFCESVSNIRASGGVLRRESSITRNNGRPLGRVPRYVNSGSSERIVPIPTRSASIRSLKSCPYALLSGEVIHLPSFFPEPIFPSRVIPTLETTSGRPVVVKQAKLSIISPARSAINSTSTCIPADRSLSTPRPDTFGKGSILATTTRRTPLRIKSSAQGGVLP